MRPTLTGYTGDVLRPVVGLRFDVARATWTRRTCALFLRGPPTEAPRNRERVTPQTRTAYELNLDSTRRPRVVRVLRDARIRHLLTGVFNTAWSYLLFSALVLSTGGRLHYLVILAITHVVTVLTAFLIYSRLVFPTTGFHVSQLLRFWSVYLVAIIFNAVALPLLVEGVTLPVLLAQMLIVGVTAAMSFLGHKHWSFRHDGPAA